MKNFIAKAIIAGVHLEDGKAPSWMLLFKAGWNEIEGEGRYLVDNEAYEVLATYIRRRGNDIVFDYEHQSVETMQAPAAGWIKELRYDDGKGIMARVEWTQKASDHIAQNEYRYFSPVFYVRKTDNRPVAIHSVALTNTPKHNHLNPILAKLELEQKEETMDWLKKLLAKLGLQEGASGEDVITAITKLSEKPPETKEVIAKEVINALEIEEGDVSTVVASIHALKQAGKGVVSRQEFDTLQAKLRKQDADKVVAKAIAAGKVTPDQKEWADDYAKKDLEGFKTFITKAPVVVPVSDLPKKQDTVDADGLTDTDLQIAKMMDVSKEDFKTYGPDTTTE